MPPHLLPHRRDMFVVERRPGRLGKRAGRLGRQGAVGPVRQVSSILGLLRRPGSLAPHDSVSRSALSRSLGPSRLDRAVREDRLVPAAVSSGWWAPRGARG